jgi:cyclophilin family peptidyl-prolyl cis-trans isomerase
MLSIETPQADPSHSRKIGGPHAWLRILLVGSCLSAPALAATPAAPTNCVASGIGFSAGGASIRLNWTDHSTNETQWLIYYSTNNGVSFAYLGPVASDSTLTAGTTVSVGWTGALKNTTYLFRIYAYNGSEYSDASNDAAVTTGVFTLTASKVQCQAAITLAWPNVPNVSGYEVFAAAPGDASYTSIGALDSSATTCTVTAAWLVPTQTYYFVVQPYMGNFYLGQSNEASAVVDYPAVMTSKPGASNTPGAAFTHTFTHASAAMVSSRTLTGDVTGLTFNSSAGTLSGVFPALGNYTLNYAVHFSTGSTLTQTFYIRVRPPKGAPLVATAIPAWTAASGASRDTPLAGKFIDPEAESAVRVSTTLGTMDFILFDTATPDTVANFKSYVNAEAYTDVMFHRCILGFMNQTGGFKGTGTGSGSDNPFTSVVTHVPVMNEPGIPNMRGTLSMAKSGNSPNSATSQFFVSVSNNNEDPYPDGLDYQNGGFTVFGRVAGNGMTVADAINNLPRGNYTSPPANLTVDGSSAGELFANCPMNADSAPATMDQTKLMKINSVTSIPTMNYSITGNTNPTVASADIVNGQLRLVGLTGGQTTVTVTATDLDNLSTSQTVTADIKDSYSTWASRNTFPGGQNTATQNPDADGWNNLQEYAFLGDPALPNRTSLTIFAGTTGAAPAARSMTLTFPVRKSTTGLTYIVQANHELTGAWTEIWRSTDEFSYGVVVSALDESDRTVVTIRDSEALGTRQKRFIRLKLVQE